MHKCPNCNSADNALIVWGFELDHIVEILIKEKKIVFGEHLKVNEKLKYHCNDCKTPWGKHDK